MAGKIFISYRRDDDPSAAARVCDGLSQRFGKANLFIDIDNLLAGQRFDIELAKALAACDVLIVIIGRRWMELLKAKISNGERDHVREEIAAALQRRIVVIPARVGREGQMPPLPRSADLPSDIRDLVLFQKHDVTHERFGRDIAELIKAITVVRQLNRPKAGVSLARICVIAASVLLGTYVGAHYSGVSVPWPGSSAAVTDLNTTQIAMQKSRAEQEARAEADRRQAEAEDKRRADEAAKAEADRRQAEAEAKRGADDEAVRVALAEKNREQAAQIEAYRRQAEAEAKRRADEAAKAEADRRQAEAEAKRQAEQAAAPRDPALSVTPGSGQSFRDRLANGQPCPMCPEMVVAPAGKFMMGSPASEPQRSDDEAQVGATIARPFAVARFAVTFAEWDACVADGGCKGYWPNDRWWGRDRRPVIHVNWDDAKLYIDWLNAKTGKTYRLLSEAEREYVTRAATTTPFWWGAAITPKQANYDGSAEPYKGGGTKGEYRRQTVPVDSFEANPWGLFNVHGNVWEWAEDCWNDSNQGNPGNGSARTTGDCGRRVVRGGSWFNGPQGLRSAYRGWNTTVDRESGFGYFGFRLARTLNR